MSWLQYDLRKKIALNNQDLKPLYTQTWMATFEHGQPYKDTSFNIGVDVSLNSKTFMATFEHGQPYDRVITRMAVQEHGQPYNK
jgi:hypothetical protein